MEQDYLIHYGVLGMKWGKRKSNKTRYSTRRKAKKDAKEFARAKMFYGEGAGNRRKLIKATVNQRSKDLKGYKQEFDKNLSKQDMAKHATKAKRERVRKTAAKSTAKTARGVIHAAAGNTAKAAASAVALYSVAKITGIDKVIADNAKIAVNNIKIGAKIMNGARKQRK